MVYTIAWYLCRWIARAFFALKIEGAEHVPEAGPVILAPNHVSYVDPVLIAISVRRRVHSMAKRELFRNPAMAWFFRALQGYPITRERVDPSSVKHTLSLLAAGHVVVIFPEGTRGDGEALGPAKSGIGVVAARSGACVVPVFHWGSDRILPRGARWLRRAPLRIRFGPPLRFRTGGAEGTRERVDRDATETFGRQLMEAIAALRPTAEQPRTTSR
ncbi:MAG: lysophospholipid acyltransferase family protein [Candidatus Methylomirabilota bacterium]